MSLITTDARSDARVRHSLPAEQSREQFSDPTHGQPRTSDLTLALLRNRLLIIASVLTAIGLGVAYTAWARPEYEAVSTVRFDAERLDLPQVVQAPASDNLIGTELEVLRGRDVARMLVDSLNLRARLVAPRRAYTTGAFALLRVSADADTGVVVLRRQRDSSFAVFRPGTRDVKSTARVGDTLAIDGLTMSLAPAARAMPEIRLQVDPLEAAVRRTQSQFVAARPAKDADLISIRTHVPDPAQAAAMANLLAASIVDGRKASRRDRTSAAADFLTGQATSLQRQLHDAEDSLSAYQLREHVADAPEQSRAEVGRLAGLAGRPGGRACGA